MIKYLTLLFLLTCCSNTVKQVFDKNNDANKNLKNNFLSKSTENEKKQDDFNYLLYRYCVDNLTEQQKEEKYSMIEEGFFESIFLEKIEENDNDNKIEDDTEQVEEDTNEDQDNDNQITTDRDNNYGSKVKIPVYHINIIKLKEKLKIKERDRNVCHINKNITITPNMTLITNKKRRATLKLTINF